MDLLPSDQVYRAVIEARGGLALDVPFVVGANDNACTVASELEADLKEDETPKRRNARDAIETG
jgi:hypothetical protein